MTESACEREFDFYLVMAGTNCLTPDFENALFDVGCDDATVAMVNRTVLIEFSRKAPSLKDAVLSAIRDVHKAGGKVAHIDACNSVTQAEIARRIKRTRQFVHQLITGHRGPGGFPLPVCQMNEDTPLWQWCAISFWLSEIDMIRPEEVHNSAMIAAINATLELAQCKARNPELMIDITNELAEIEAFSESRRAGSSPGLGDAEA